MPFKILRIYNIWLLHYPAEAFINVFYSDSDEKYRSVLIYAWSTVCKIILLLHFFAILWIWIGTETFAELEPGYTPWLIGTSDFESYSRYQIYVFSLYWVCEVVTTVGYGDYSGGTTLELIFSVMLEFMGIVIFAAL